MQRSSSLENSRPKRPFSPACCFIVFGRIVTPSSGAKITATIHETSSEIAMTTNSVKVNSPAALLLRPIGMKPATVTSVPVSIGKAVEV
ncbi:hypothetical protein D3C72_2195620 [compost metagenome]